jgi:hypothetical protein
MPAAHRLERYDSAGARWEADSGRMAADCRRGGLGGPSSLDQQAARGRTFADWSQGAKRGCRGLARTSLADLGQEADSSQDGARHRHNGRCMNRRRCWDNSRPLAHALAAVRSVDDLEPADARTGAGQW